MSRRCITTASILFVATALNACAMSSMAQQDEPALLVAPSEQTRKELADAVRKSMQGVPVTLSPDAFTKESSLSIERAAARVGVGQRIDARETDLPVIFRLVKHGSTCVLINDSTEARTPLVNASCESNPG